MTSADPDIRNKLTPGAHVKVTQQIAARNHTWTTTVTGTVIEYAQKQTGSWFAHAANDKLWLDRLVIKKDDGEITTLILDDYTYLEIDGPSTSAVDKKNESDLPV